MEANGSLIDESVFALCPGCNQIVWGVRKVLLNSKDREKIINMVMDGKTIKTLPTPIKQDKNWHCTCQIEFKF
jgi:hypothetical protein